MLVHQLAKRNVQECGRGQLMIESKLLTSVEQLTIPETMII